ncbi:MAG: hypothetical protein JNK05_03370 [Myxococcales bacterium]|nr:hypothetical protein [Myxococcales bacterium]
MDPKDRWYAMYYILDDDCWGLLAEHSESGVYATEHKGKRVVPSFHRFEHVALFVRQFDGSPAIERGASYDLVAVHEYATGAREIVPDNVEDVWLFLIDVAMAADPELALAYPSDGEEPRAALRECFDAFRAALAHLDDPPEDPDDTTD